MIITDEMRVIQKVISKYIKYNLVYSEQEAKTPTKKFACFKLISMEPKGLSTKKVHNDKYITRVQKYDFCVQFDCFGEKANEIAFKIQDLKTINEVKNLLFKSKISWIRNSSIINTTQMNETEQIKTRVTLESYFQTLHEINEVIQTIEKVKLNVKFR
jgi:hypothetical protein